VVGPNGAGKSSLLKALAGALPLRDGDITYSQPTRGRLAYLPQQSELDRDYPVTVAELVALGAWRSIGAFRPLSKNLLPSIDGAIAQVGLESFSDRLIVELSAGQLRRALFARLIVQDASLILLDEPFAGIDEDTTAELFQLIKSWHSEQRTIIAVMHDIDQVRAYFPSTLLLARRCISWGDTETALCRYSIPLEPSRDRNMDLPIRAVCRLRLYADGACRMYRAGAGQRPDRNPALAPPNEP
jgi:zinc/manganese transport system ATP-binding protein